MGAGVNRHVVTMDDRLAKLAGFTSVTCRYLGPRQQGAIALDVQVRQAEHRRAAGEQWAERMVDKVEVSAADRAEMEERIAERKRTEPVEWALSQWPADLVCRHAVKARDGQADTPERIDAWLDDGPHPEVVREIAVGVLRASGLIPESEEARGEGSGASSAAS